MKFSWKFKQQWLKVLVFSLCCFVLSVGVACGSNSVLTGNVPISSTTAAAIPAGSVQLQFAGTAPNNVTVGSVAFVQIPVTQAWVAPVQQATTMIPVTDLQKLGASNLQLSSSRLGSDLASTGLIYQNDPTNVTFEDFVLVFATSTLPPNLRTAANIATQANTLFASGNFSAAGLNPVPTSINTDYVLGGSTPPPDLTDAALVYAATFLPANLRTRENLAATLNALLPGANVVPADILAIPGVELPGGITVTPAVTSRPAGSFQVSVQINNLATPSFTLGAAQFIRIPTTVFPGFTSYAAEPGSSLIPVAFNQLQIPNVPSTACVIIHVAGQDPRIEDTQIARSATCEGITLTQIDRMAIPGFITVFIPPNPLEPQVPSPSLEDAFNRGLPVNDDRDFRDEVVNSLEILFSLNDTLGDNPADDEAAIQGLADALVPDILPFNLDQPSGFATLNGRNLEDDVIDIALGLLSEGACTSDLVGNDSVFLNQFPYFGVPN